MFTGGTIGSSAENGIIAPQRETTKLLIEMYEKEYGSMDFDITEPYYALSENNTGKTLSRLAKAVCDAESSDYSGIIIAHGTDTLQYSAAALSFALGNCSKPVLLVSSNYVLTDKRANGLSNFAAAVDFIKHRHGTGVFVPYKNSDKKVYVHRASRLLQHSELSDDVFSIKNQYYGSYNGTDFIKNPDFSEKADQMKPFGRFSLSDFSNEIEIFNAAVGRDYPILTDCTKAVLIKSYHSGTICTENEQFKAFAKNAAERHIPCYLCGAESGNIYESAAEFAKHGIISLPPASFISQYIKLWLCLQNGIDFDKVRNQSLGGDLLNDKYKNN